MPTSWYRAQEPFVTYTYAPIARGDIDAKNTSYDKALHRADVAARFAVRQALVDPELAERRLTLATETYSRLGCAQGHAVCRLAQADVACARNILAGRGFTQSTTAKARSHYAMAASLTTALMHTPHRFNLNRHSQAANAGRSRINPHGIPDPLPLRETITRVPV